MKINQTIISSLNKLIQSEYRSSLNYLQIANWFELSNFPGIASHFRVESAAERDHALLIVDHLLKVGVNASIPHEFDHDLPIEKLNDNLKHVDFFSFSRDSELILLKQMSFLFNLD